jgi:hypothetical protein
MTKPFTITDLTRRWRCSRQRVKDYIEEGRLQATKLPGGPNEKYVIQPEAVEAFERGEELKEQKRRADNARRREAIRRRKRMLSHPVEEFV